MNIKYFNVTFFALVASLSTVFSQDTLLIDWSSAPGHLEETIMNDGDQHDVYILQADKVYLQRTKINTDRSIAIIGEAPSEGQHPATIQPFPNDDGSSGFVGWPTVNVEAQGENIEVVLRNLLLNGASVDGSFAIGGAVTARGTEEKIIIDHCVLTNYEYVQMLALGTGTDFHFTSSVAKSNSAQPGQQFWGGLLWGGGSWMGTMDTVIIQNSSIMNMTGEAVVIYTQVDYGLIDQCTFANITCSPVWYRGQNNLTVKNNLFLNTKAHGQSQFDIDNWGIWKPGGNGTMSIMTQPSISVDGDGNSVDEFNQPVQDGYDPSNRNINWHNNVWWNQQALTDFMQRDPWAWDVVDDYGYTSTYHDTMLALEDQNKWLDDSTESVINSGVGVDEWNNINSDPGINLSGEYLTRQLERTWDFRENGGQMDYEPFTSKWWQYNNDGDPYNEEWPLHEDWSYDPNSDAATANENGGPVGAGPFSFHDFFYDDDGDDNEGGDCELEIEGYTYIGSFNNSCYYRSTTPMRWASAIQQVESNGGHLATISSQEENDFLGENGGWIGFTDEANEGEWVWVTGEEVTYTQWAGGEPNNSGEEDCAQRYAGDGNWNDASCSGQNNFFLEIPLTNNPDDDAGYPQSDHILARYDFSGNADDVSGNGHHGTLQGGVSLTDDKDGNPNSAYYFDGSNGTRINCGDQIELANKSHTISILAKQDNSSHSGHFFAHGVMGANTGLHCRTQPGTPNGTIRYGFWNNDLDVYNTYSESLDWHHYVFVFDYDLGTRKLYIDGNLMSPSGENTNPYVGSGDFAIGSIVTNSNSSGSWIGALDEVIVWDTALSETEVGLIGTSNTEFEEESLVQLSVSMGMYSDNDNFLGTTTTASNEFDATSDVVEPPASPGDGVSLYFPHPEWNHMLGDNFSTDIRPVIDISDTMQVWNFSVLSTDDGEATLEFNIIYSPEVPLVFEHSEAGYVEHIHDMGSSYTFNASAGVEHGFTISIGDTTAPELNLGGIFSGPSIFISGNSYGLDWDVSDAYLVDHMSIHFSQDGGNTFTEQYSSDDPFSGTEWTAPYVQNISHALFLVEAVDYAGNVTVAESDYHITLVGDSLSSFVPAGWSLWGVPIAPYNDETAYNLEDDFTGYWATYDYVDNGYTYDGVLYPAEGYWIAAADDADVDVLGVPIDQDFTLVLSMGWDLISNPLVTDVSLDSIVFTKDGTSSNYNDAVSAGWVNSIYGFNGEGYEVVENHLMPWSGYWISVVEDGVDMTMPIHRETDGHGHMNRDEETIISFLAEISGANDRMMEIGYSEHATDLFDNDYDALKPPAPPGPDYVSVFVSHPDWGHVLGDKFTRDIRSTIPVGGYQEWILTLESSQNTINLSWALGEIAEEYEVGYSTDGGAFFGDMRSVDMVSLSLDDQIIVRIGTMVLDVDSEPLPTEFVLEQNYPNPFNPVTQISYQIPEDSDVNINIYDLMGHKIKSLVSSSQKAGYKSIVWNATNEIGSPVAAGMYIYTIEAGSFRQSKKMLLLK